MFEFARKNSFLMQFVLFLMIASLVLVLFVDYDMVSDNRPVAKVGKAEIGTREFEQYRQNFITEQQQRNPGADASLFNTPEIQKQLLEQLVREEVLAQSARDLRLPISDQSLSAYLQQLTRSMGWLKPDGSTDTEAYKKYLTDLGQTPAGYEARLRSSLAQNQLLAGLAASVTENSRLQKVTLDALQEKREVQAKGFPPADLEKDIRISEEAVKAYYDSHQNDFQVAEQADAEYLVLSLQSIKDSIQPSDEEVRDYYEQNRENYDRQEERKIRHILIEVADDDAAAREKTEEVLAKAKAAPETFAALAEQFSSDADSASSGGSLGYFKRDGSMPKPFEDAAFSLAANTLSELVKTDFGYHILLVDDIKEATFEQFKSDIISTIKDSQAQTRFRDEAEQFANMVYEAGDLQGVAKRFGLTIQTADRLQADGAQNAAAAAEPVYAPAFLTELFGEESTASRQNTAAVDIGEDRLIAGRILKLYPAHTAAFDTVQAEVKKRLMQKTAVQESRKKAVALRNALKEGDANAQKELGQATIVSRLQPSSLPHPIIEAALKVKRDRLPSQVLVNLDSNGWAVVQVNRIAATDGSNPQSAGKDAMLKQLWSEALGEAQYRQQKADLDVEILWQPPQPDSEATD